MPGAASAATAFLRSRLRPGTRIDIKRKGRDRYKHILALVRHQGQDINGLMVSSGHAWVYTRYCKAAVCRHWHARRGLWRNSNPMPPWKWRRKK